MTPKPQGRKFEMELELAAPAERVWEVIASKEGIQSWFAPEARVTPGAGGEVWISWGSGMEGASAIEVWDPNRHLRYSSPRGEGRDPNVVDFTIEAKSGDKTILRLVNSGFGADASFDAEVESTSRAWPLFMLLAKHAAEHPHKRCVNECALTFLQTPRNEAWEKLKSSLPTGAQVRHINEPGLVCYELPDSNRSLLAVFCENCGEATTITVMCLLYDPTPEQQARGKKLAESIANFLS